MSLWDLKQFDIEDNAPSIYRFELCPYGIWNLLQTLYWSLLSQNLNFVPMGFETSKVERYRDISELFELCPYGIWNFLINSLLLFYSFIWTLSLWDLKREKNYHEKYQ